MGKGGAPTTTQTVQNQNVSYTPTGLQGFQDIYNKAAGVASQPYQPYGGQLVQGLTPTQTSAIGQISNTGPIGDADIQKYMNPYQSNVIDATMANINETNRQQFADTTGKLQQSAGGIGASRIALGQGELARQQGLASNQTLAGLQQQNYMQALQAAQQQQGFGLGKAQAQLGAGGLEQQTGQAGLTANYQQYLQQLAFPYQQAQFMAGIGLPALGAMGGSQYQTGSANQTMTPPGMSWLQGLTGAGAIGYGLYKGGAFDGSGGGGGYPTMQGITDPTMARGGRAYPYFADGGDVNDDPSKTLDLGPDEFSRQEDEALAPVLGKSGYVPTESGPTKMPDSMPKPMAPIPSPSQGGSGGAGGGGGGVDWGSIAKIAGTAAMMFIKSGGRVPGYDDGGPVPQQPNSYPSPSMLGRPITQGALPQQAQMNSPNVFYGKPLPNMLPSYPVSKGQPDPNQSIYEMARQALQQQQFGQALASIRGHASGQPEVSVSEQEYARGGYAGGGYTDDDLDNIISPYVNSGNYSVPRKSPSGFPPVTDLDSSPSANRMVAERFPRLDARDYGLDDREGDSYGPRSPYPKDIPSGGFDWRFPRDMPPSQANYGDDATGAVARHFPAEWGESGPTDIAKTPLNPLATGVDVNRGAKGDRLPMALPATGPTPVPTVSVRRSDLDNAPTDISGDSPYPRVRSTRGAGGVFDPATASSREIMNLDNYKSQVAQRPTVRGLMDNPDFWMRTGLGILAANPSHGPIGAVASGALGTVGQYDQWSKEDLNSKQKAQELAGKLMEHAKKYTTVDANTRAHLGIEQERLKQGRWQAFNYQDEDGHMKAGFMDTKTRQLVGADGQPINPARIYGRTSRVESQDITPQQMSIIIDRYRKNHPATVGMSDEEVRDAALKEARQNTRQKDSEPGTQSNPLPDPGAGKRIKGRWYIGPSGAPQPWLGE